MSKFRARQLDATKPIPIYLQEEISDYTDLNNASNRTVPQMPTGMEKEEETEHHLQQAIFHHRVIPVPEVYAVDSTHAKIYPPDYKQPRQLIHILPFNPEQDIPDYDMDSEDEEWLSQQAAKGELLPLDPPQFEEMMDRLEKSSGLKAVTLQEAKVLLKDDDGLITAVYDYWLNKRLKTQHTLIPQVKSEKSAGSAPSDPYVAFRKRTEKMQTRKNRKNDESSYEKMLKLKRDLTKSLTMLQMVSRREKTKRELLHLHIEIFEKRYELQDWSGSIISELLNSRPMSRSAFAPLVSNHLNSSALAATSAAGGGGGGARGGAGWLKVGHNRNNLTNASATHRNKDNAKRERKNRKAKLHASLGQPSSGLQRQHAGFSHPPDPYLLANAYPSSLEEDDTTGSGGGGRGGTSQSDDDAHADGSFTFIRRHHCQYHAPREDTVWAAPHEGGGGANHAPYSLTSLPPEYLPRSPSPPSSCLPTDQNFPPTFSSLSSQTPPRIPSPSLSQMPTIRRTFSTALSPIPPLLSSSLLTSAFSFPPSGHSSLPSTSSTFTSCGSDSLSSNLVPLDGSLSKFEPSTSLPQLPRTPAHDFTPVHLSSMSRNESSLPGPDASAPSSLKSRESSSPNNLLTSHISNPSRRHITLARRRLGRGGRIWIDRLSSASLDDRAPSAAAAVEHCGVALTSATRDILAQLHSATALWRPGNERVSCSLPEFRSVVQDQADGGESEAESEGRSSPLDPSYLQSYVISAEVMEGENEGLTTDVEMSIPSSILLGGDSRQDNEDVESNVLLGSSHACVDGINWIDSKSSESLLLNSQELPPVFSPDRCSQFQPSRQHSNIFSLLPSSRFSTYDASISNSGAATQPLPSACDNELVEIDPSLPEIINPPRLSRIPSSPSNVALNHRPPAISQHSSGNFYISNSLLNVSSSNSSTNRDFGVRTVTNLDCHVSAVSSGSFLVNNSESVWTASSDECSYNKIKVSEGVSQNSGEESSAACTGNVSSASSSPACVNNVDSSNKLTSSSFAVSSSILRTSTSSTVSKSGHQRLITNSSHSPLNNCNAHVRSNSNGSTTEASSRYRVLNDKSSTLPHNSVVKTNNNGNNSMSNGPVRNNAVHSKSSTSGTTTTTTSMPVVRCAKLDQYLFRDS